MREGIKVGLRFTMNRRNASEIPKILELMKAEGVPRICFYHLVYTGAGSSSAPATTGSPRRRRRYSGRPRAQGRRPAR
jgi:MoaA/NifB/PqqE/SkfB family radical SAM enzyme